MNPRKKRKARQAEGIELYSLSDDQMKLRREFYEKAKAMQESMHQCLESHVKLMQTLIDSLPTKEKQ